MSNGPEYIDVQRPARELLKDHFGYEYADGRNHKKKTPALVAGVGPEMRSPVGLRAS
jgi:hypothetical protein